MIVWLTREEHIIIYEHVFFLRYEIRCMKSFRWDKANPYKSDKICPSCIPTIMSEVTNLPFPGKVEIIVHLIWCMYILQAEVAIVMQRVQKVPGTNIKMRCDLCGENIIGPTFTCVHCPV